MIDRDWKDGLDARERAGHCHRELGPLFQIFQFFKRSQKVGGEKKNKQPDFLIMAYQF